MAFEGTLTRFTDQVLGVAKRLEERYYAPAYRELELRAKGLGAIKRPSLTSPGSILIYKPDEIGDAVVALPALLALRREHPKAWIGILSQEKAAGLYERTKLFNEVVGIPVKVRLRRFPHLDLAAGLKQFSKSHFEMGVFLRTYPSYFSFFRKLPVETAIHPLDPRLQWRNADAMTPLVSLWQKERPHQILQMWQTLAPLLDAPAPGNPLTAEFPSLCWSAEDEVAGLPDKYVVLHPYNDLVTKRYPIEEWRLLIQRIRSVMELPVFVVGGKTDPEFPEETGVMSLKGKLSLTQTGYVISRATAFVGTSSGPSHLAAALGIPTLGVLSGHTAREEWRLVGKSLSLRADTECTPCHSRHCLRGDLACLTELTPDRIWPYAEKFFSALKAGQNFANQDIPVFRV